MENATKEVKSEILTSPDYPGQRFERTGEKRRLHKDELYIGVDGEVTRWSLWKMSDLEWPILRLLPDHYIDADALEREAQGVANVPEQGISHEEYQRYLANAEPLKPSVVMPPAHVPLPDHKVPFDAGYQQGLSHGRILIADKLAALPHATGQELLDHYDAIMALLKK